MAARVASTAISGDSTRRNPPSWPLLLVNTGPEKQSNTANEGDACRTALDASGGMSVQLPGQLVGRLRGARHGAQSQLAAHHGLRAQYVLSASRAKSSTASTTAWHHSRLCRGTSTGVGSNTACRKGHRHHIAQR